MEHPTSAQTTPTAATDELRRALASEEGGQRWLRRGALVLVAGILVGGGLYYRATHRPAPPAKYVTAPVGKGDIVEKVQATGAVQPMRQVQIGAQVNGRVAAVYVDFNAKVTRGQVLAEIDPVVYGAQVNQQQATLRTQLAQIESARAAAETARLNYERTAKLFEQNLASKGEFDSAKGQFDIERMRVQAAEAQIGVVQAQLAQSQTNVSWTKIYSPVEGIVISRTIDPGATVVASFQTPTLFVIAEDLSKMRILADVDEADVGRLKEGMKAEAVVDAFPGEVFQGVVQQIRYSPNNVQGVVTYSAVVEVQNLESKLRPGMTATVTVRTRESNSVVRIPNAALRYKPSPPKGPDGKPLPVAPAEPPAKGTARVFVMVNEKPGEEKIEPRVIPVGVTDGIYTELTGAALPLDTKVVTDETDEEDKKKPKVF